MDILKILSDIQNNPTLQRSLMLEADALYSETLVIPESFTGNYILQNTEKDSYYDETIDNYLKMIFNYEKKIELALSNANLNGTHFYTEYINILNKEVTKQKEYDNLRESVKHAEDDYTLEQLYDEFYPALFNEDEFIQNKERLFNAFLSQEFVYTCNYKGEINGEDLKINTLHMRKFISKYNYQ